MSINHHGERMDLDKVITEEAITPKIAQDWLNLNPCNRKLRPGVAEKYAADMSAGKWTECLDPIAFYQDNELADGQHRLWGIVLSGTTQSFYVVRNFPREAGLNIDTGLGRTLVDNARISRVDKNLSNQIISSARAIEIGDRTLTGRSMSFSETEEVVAKHREVAEWLNAHGPKGRYIRNASVLGAVGRAWYVERDHNKLARFCAVLSDGFSEGTKESAAVALRNYLLANGQLATVSTRWRDTFLKVQNAIKYFMRDKPLGTIRGVDTETYPLKQENRSTDASVIKVAKKKAKLTADEATKQAKELLKQNVTVVDTAKRIGYSRAFVYRVKNYGHGSKHHT